MNDKHQHVYYDKYINEITTEDIIRQDFLTWTVNTACINQVCCLFSEYMCCSDTVVFPTIIHNRKLQQSEQQTMCVCVCVCVCNYQHCLVAQFLSC